MSMRRALAGLTALLLAAPITDATTLVQMNLADLSSRAGRIFRGTVIAIDAGTVKAGGGEVPIVTYKFKLADTLKGDFMLEGGSKYVEVRMLDAARSDGRADGVRHVSPFRDLPLLERGREYLLFTTMPSRLGLSTTVGLGQGAFRIEGEGDTATVINAFGNAGLFARMTTTAARGAQPGAAAMTYGDIAARIRGLAGR